MSILISCVLFNTNLRSKEVISRQSFLTCGKATKFFVASGRIHSPPMSKETLTTFGKLRIQPHGCFTDPDGLAILKKGHSANTVKQEKDEQDMKDLTYKYSHLFQGTGKIKDKVE